ncbi:MULTISPECIES: hypothetical protein [unclassified Streptomyces]|uniref:hypothetical protein n=1 Tax=unclassified Streptomyces TaxID=2593676 RepID=UPI001BE9C10F|nr:MULTISPECIES: hypothetical protein [unclassified Streptomyces]MBT2403100.1 hypothetical protein [Streptomyces sp. ISL-21]MBT2610223.1 hypothetical protein [Streptomyces sp. ISL-87]
MPEYVDAVSPFPSLYQLGDEITDPVGEEFQALLGELYDDEFDLALWGLVQEGEAHLRQIVPGPAEEAGGYRPDQVRAERLLRTWAAPLQESADDLLGRMAAALEAEDPDVADEHRIEELLESVPVTMTDVSAAFDEFLGSLKKKAKKLAKRAAGLARKGIAAAGRLVPAAVLLRRLAPLVRPLLQRVLRLALDRLPPALRPYASRLAQRYLKTAGEAPAADVAVPTTVPDAAALQLRFDASLAELLLAADEYELQTLVAAEAVAADDEQDDTLALFDEGRERFVEGLARLEEGQDPTRLVEEFLPVAALRLGVRIVGRERVVHFLATYLGRLIAPYVGPRISPALSRAIVDAGLRMLTLEAPDEESGEPDGANGLHEGDTRRLAAEALAALVEDATAHVTQLDEETLDDPLLLEAALVEAGRDAAATSFPYEVLRPDGLADEATRPAVPWVAMPRRGPRRYRKCARIFDVTLTPQLARAVRVFGGRTLDSHLRDRFGTAGPVRARIHLYQAVPGSRLDRIARSEAGLLGWDSGSEAPWELLHPLTPIAAGLLLGDPALGGKEVAAPDDLTGHRGRFPGTPGAPLLGQRFYAVQVPGVVTRSRPGRGTRGAARRRTGPPVTVLLDGRTKEIRVALHLPEAKAQTMAAALRRGDSPAVTLAALRHTLRAALGEALSDARDRRVRVAEATPEASQLRTGPEHGGPGQGGPGRGGTPTAADRLTTWASLGLSRALARDRRAFVAATEDPADGVTLLVQLVQPPGFDELRAHVKRRESGTTDSAPLHAALAGAPRDTRVEIVPGYRRA